MAFKPVAPGVPTGGEGSATVGNKDYYPSDKSEGYVTGGEPSGSSYKESNVPSRPNPQSGNLSQEKANIKQYAQESANYGGHNQSFNPTGSSVSSPEGDRTTEDDGFYGTRPGSSPGTNAGGTGDAVRVGATDPYGVEEDADAGNSDSEDE